MLLRLYADESEATEIGILRVAGYLMTEEQWQRLDENTAIALGSLKWFHMKERHHRTHPQIYKRLLDTITSKSVLAGFSVSLDKREYEAVMSQRDEKGNQTYQYWMGSAYTFLVQKIMGLCGNWCNSRGRNDDWIAYFFESGHPSQGDANTFLEMLWEKQNQTNRTTARYSSHTFLPKEGLLSRALIPCDILAWNLTNWRRGGPQCPQLIHLLQVETQYIDFRVEHFRREIQKMRRRWMTFDKKGRLRKPR